jgi:hypothetical protein
LKPLKIKELRSNLGNFGTGIPNLSGEEAESLNAGGEGFRTFFRGGVSSRSFPKYSSREL